MPKCPESDHEGVVFTKLKYRFTDFFRYFFFSIRYFSVFGIPTSVSVSVFWNSSVFGIDYRLRTTCERSGSGKWSGASPKTGWAGAEREWEVAWAQRWAGWIGHSQSSVIFVLIYFLVLVSENSPFCLLGIFSWALGPLCFLWSHPYTHPCTERSGCENWMSGCQSGRKMPVFRQYLFYNRTITNFHNYKRVDKISLNISDFIETYVNVALLA